MGIFPRTKFLIYNIVIVIVKFYSNPFDKFYYYLWNDETKFKNNKISTSTIHHNFQIAKYLEESLFIKSYISFKYRLISFFPTVGKKSKIKKKVFRNHRRKCQIATRRNRVWETVTKSKSSVEKTLRAIRCAFYDPALHSNRGTVQQCTFLNILYVFPVQPCDFLLPNVFLSKRILNDDWKGRRSWITFDHLELSSRFLRTTCYFLSYIFRD